ncbi:MAG: hypothetical protein Q9162_006422 [Coniocarpon cinnabarinum]
MATRDRYGGFSEPPSSPLQRLIQNACDPQNYEPNLALDLEIADLINSKKGTATKEFLNELVRRFPERPPLRYSRVQSKILELIEEWRSTICQTSKYKEDLGFIRDMHRLLSYKGYTFPAVRREDAAVLNPSDALKSAEEMEAEEREHQSAKLQELIRRGSPHDLQEANRLMKIMAGYDNRRKTDYRAKAAEEVSKIQQKARILEEMLQNFRPDDKESAEGAEELSSALASAQPKIQKMCEEESDDHEAVAKLFEINDSIHRTIERYRLVKSGDVEGASRIPRGTLGTSGAGVQKGPGNELSLIDFGTGETPITAAPSEPGGQGTSQGDSSLENDLIGLSLGDDAQNAGGQISLGGAQQPPQAAASSASSKQSIMNAFNQPPSQPASFTQQPLPHQQSMPPSNFTQPTAPLQAPLPQLPPQQPSSFAASPVSSNQPPPPQKAPLPDPFASLSSVSTTSTRTSSPFQFQQAATFRPPPSQTQPQSITPQPNNTASLLSTTSSQPSNQSNGVVPPDDDWAFTSSLPDNAHDITVTNGTLYISFSVSRPSSAPELLIRSSISNNTPQPISDLEFQAAVSRGLSLKMEPQSSRMLAAKQRNGISQIIRLEGVEMGKGITTRVRWKVGYWLENERREEKGELPGLGIA